MVDLQMEMDMDCVAKLTEDQRIAFLKAFSRLAAADGHLDPEEKEFIRHVAVSFGVSSRRVDEILQILFESIHIRTHGYHPVGIKCFLYIFLFPTLFAHVGETEINCFSFFHICICYSFTT